MSERKFASVQKVVEIIPLDGYDKVELAMILGWCCIVQKNQFKVDDFVIFIEPDSKLPPRKEYDFLEKRDWKVKTLKMCKTISQGLILPIDVLPEIWKTKKVVENMDLTSDFGITHIDNLEEAKDNRKYNFFQKLWRRFYFKFFRKKDGNDFPKQLISETNEPNVQTIPKQLMLREGASVTVTEKLEGQSATFGLVKKKGIPNRLHFIVCSHHKYYPTSVNNNFWKVATEFKIEEKLRQYYKATGKLLILQGEIIGDKIQNNIYDVRGFDFFVFNVKDLSTGKKLSYSEASEIVIYDLDLKMVPLIDIIEISKVTTPQWWLTYSNGKSVLANVPREGVVVRTADGTLSFKVKSPEYQLWFK